MIDEYSLGKFNSIFQKLGQKPIAIVSVQYPTGGFLTAIRSLIDNLLKTQKAYYLAMLPQQLAYISVRNNEVSDIQFMNLDEIQQVSFTQTSAESITFPTLEFKYQKKNYRYMLFPTLFNPDLSYSDKPEHIMYFISMRDEIIQKLRMNIRR